MALQLAKICTNKGEKRVFHPVEPSALRVLFVLAPDRLADYSQLSDQEVMANLST
ncbi:MAG: hypothetical protein GXP01_01465 [Alphaproteobacteria bacterium]|nr:hypothetical protein [Alphaproteobacteria bacterium]